MTGGKRFVYELRKIVVVPHTRLHDAYQKCLICGADSLLTIEQFIDHIEAHPERIECRAVLKDQRWIVLCKPGDYYKQNKVRVPNSLKHLRPFNGQEQAIGIEETDLIIKLTGPRRRVQ